MEAWACSYYIQESETVPTYGAPENEPAEDAAPDAAVLFYIGAPFSLFFWCRVFCHCFLFQLFTQ